MSAHAPNSAHRLDNNKKESLNDASILQLACALFPAPGLPRPGAAGQPVRPGGDLHRTAWPRDPGPGHRPAHQRRPR
ncbi:hypothetical protein CAQ69_11900, partial [Stutzerimonas stutzeri]